MRLSLPPVRRDSRVERMSTAISAARSPAACPPSPSTTRKMPRRASMKKRSSFSVRFRPTSEWPPTRNCEVAGMGLVAAAHERPHQVKDQGDESEKKRNAEPEQNGGQSS